MRYGHPKYVILDDTVTLESMPPHVFDYAIVVFEDDDWRIIADACDLDDAKFICKALNEVSGA